MPTASYEVKPGSLVVVRGDLEHDSLVDLHSQLREVCAHDRFVILHVPETADAEVIGPEDLRALLRDAL